MQMKASFTPPSYKSISSTSCPFRQAARDRKYVANLKHPLLASSHCFFNKNKNFHILPSDTVTNATNARKNFLWNEGESRTMSTLIG